MNTGQETVNINCSSTTVALLESRSMECNEDIEELFIKQEIVESVNNIGSCSQTEIKQEELEIKNEGYIEQNSVKDAFTCYMCGEGYISNDNRKIVSNKTPAPCSLCRNREFDSTTGKIMEDEDLETFLKNRGIDDNTLLKLENEKISAADLNLMDDNKLKAFFHKYEDRIAIRKFLQQMLSLPLQTPGQVSLLDNLKQKLKRKMSKYEPANSSDSDCGQNYTKKVGNHTKKIVLRKVTRRLVLGWMHSDDGRPYRQVRAKKGGGTRTITVPNTANKNDVIAEGKRLFFPNGSSHVGALEDLVVDLRDSTANVLDDESTVSDIHERIGFSHLRLYLYTHKNAGVTNKNVDVKAAGKISFILPTITSHESGNQAEILSEPTSNRLFTKDAKLKLITYSDENLEVDSSNPTREILPISTVASPFEHLQNNLSKESNQSGKLILHQGHILNELINAFLKLEKNCPMPHIEMKFLSGKTELEYDASAVWREALSEFWDSFYKTCTVGARDRIPSLRHDYGAAHWQSVAKILYKGYVEENYFPIKLALPFLEECIGGCTKKPLHKYFINTLSVHDADIVNSALLDFDSVNIEDIQEVCENLESRCIPNPSNLVHLLDGIAHKEYIQKPRFIIDCWQEILKDLDINLDDVYEQLKPSVENILAVLTAESEFSSRRTSKVYGFLKKYVREAEDEVRRLFLRFCTGADVLVGRQITVDFIKVDGFRRSPVGHTCRCLLELPLSYDSFPEFRSEFNSLLKSQVLLMNIS